jgi:hypothetical protein
MIAFLKNILTAINMPINDFNLGYFFALTIVAITVLIIVILRIILKLIFRKKRCHNINIKSDNGNAVISCPAIMTVIKALEEEFNAFSINKVNLFRYGNKPFLEIHLDFDASMGGLPSHADKFKLRVIESLDSIFGINNIKKVNIYLHHIQLNDFELLRTAHADLEEAPEVTEITAAPKKKAKEKPVSVKAKK